LPQKRRYESKLYTVPQNKRPYSEPQLTLLTAVNICKRPDCVNGLDSLSDKVTTHLNRMYDSTESDSKVQIERTLAQLMGLENRMSV
jgi:hypothetical protein